MNLLSRSYVLARFDKKDMKHLHPINITKRHQQIFCLLIGLLWAFTSTVSAQNDRSFIRQGNRLYQAHKWTAAEVQYRKAVAQNAHNPQAVYNLGCALMMQQKDSLARSSLLSQQTCKSTTRHDVLRVITTWELSCRIIRTLPKP